MVTKDFLDEVSKDVDDVLQTQFEYIETKYVPHSDDSSLTFERLVSKKGKKISTCVLYVDIRNSVALTIKHHSITMGRIYTAFIKCVIKAAKLHNGSVRNVIGDRVMIVFPSEGCHLKSVNCAITINHICSIINTKFTQVDFKCGIGIDYGELKVLKVGIQRNGNERSQSKGMVWTGYPANFASRLTDLANKTITTTSYTVTKYPINFAYLFPFKWPPFDNTYVSNEPFYSTKEETVELSPDEFANKIHCSKNGELSLSDGKMISLKKNEQKYTYPPILITDAIMKGYKQNINTKYWKLQETKNIKDIKGEIFGADLKWKL